MAHELRTRLAIPQAQVLGPRRSFDCAPRARAAAGQGGERDAAVAAVGLRWRAAAPDVAVSVDVDPQ